MESVIRGLVVYVFLLVVFRLAGRRTLSQTSDFELVLLLIISETTQQAMVNNDHSVTNAFLLIVTLVGTSIILSHLKQRSLRLEKWLDGMPCPVVLDGKVQQEAMHKLRVKHGEILEAARSNRGLERLDQIKHAIVEPHGGISIVAKQSGGEG
jgi:uncharacterized membrane protein YcaP (DUF421 family)